jgi:carnitine-CoA ligase
MNIDPRMPPVDQVVLRNVLERQARERPEKVFAVFEDGSCWTYRETWEIAIRTANALRRLGVNQDDTVVSWLPNGPDAMRVWFGLNCLGAVLVPINLAYRGRLLEHVIGNAGATLIIAHADLATRLDEIDHAGLTSALLVGGTGRPSGLTLYPSDALDSEDSSLPELQRAIAPWDTQSIIYTSGTTGASKGVLSSYFHLRCMGMALQDMGESDRYFVNLPLFHVGGTMPVTAMLLRGGSVMVVSAFNTERFWTVVRENSITSSILLGAMAGFLLKLPVSPLDRGHSLRCVTVVPYTETSVAFGKRFGCDLYSHFNMSEVSMPIRSIVNPSSMGNCGVVREGITVRVVDENDCEVPTGTVGELLVRADSPWALSHGYNGNPQATAEAWRNGWFHTGDGFKVDAGGQYTFVDRIKDSIRRRGENISSSEVEAEVMMHPLVKEVAAVAVPSEYGEDEVLVAVVLTDGMTLEPADLIRFLLPRLPHFMVPRYVRFLTDLPRTPTHKVQKYLLRALGTSSGAWDREQAGLIIKGTRIGVPMVHR